MREVGSDKVSFGGERQTMFAVLDDATKRLLYAQLHVAESADATGRAGPLSPRRQAPAQTVADFRRALPD